MDALLLFMRGGVRCTSPGKAAFAPHTHGLVAPRRRWGWRILMVGVAALRAHHAPPALQVGALRVGVSEQRSVCDALAARLAAVRVHEARGYDSKCVESILCVCVCGPRRFVSRTQF